jgi:DNA repair photolyase
MLSPSVTKTVTSSCHHLYLSCRHLCHHVYVYCHQPVTMPNPRVTIRVPQNIYEQLPSDEKERSAFLLEAIQAKLNPPDPEDELAQLKRRVEVLEKQVGL